MVAIFGIAGACRREELTNLDVADVQAEESHLLVVIRETKTYKPRNFAIVALPDLPVKPMEIFQKYVALRPADMKSTRFFFKLTNGKACQQNVGINSIGKVPCDIATYLGLEEPKQYTGHSFQRSSASWLADSGADKDTIMRHGGWSSATVAEGYVESSEGNKKRIAAQIFGSENSVNKPPAKQAQVEKAEISVATEAQPILKFENCSSCTININFNK